MQYLQHLQISWNSWFWCISRTLYFVCIFAKKNTYLSWKYEFPSKIPNLTKTHIFRFLRVMPHGSSNPLRVNPEKNRIFGTVEFRTTNGTARKYGNWRGTRHICKIQCSPIFSGGPIGRSELSGSKYAVLFGVNSHFLKIRGA